MKEFFNMTCLIEGGYCNIPRVIVDKLESKDENESRTARILVHFFKKAYFKEGLACFRNDTYTCLRGQYVASQTELSKLFGMDKKKWDRLMCKFKAELLITTEKLKKGTRFTINCYDLLTGGNQKVKSVKKEQSAEPKKVKTDCSVLNSSSLIYPGQEDNGIYIPPLEF